MVLERSFRYVDRRAELPASATTLPARYYADPDLFQRERERIFFASWLHAGTSAGIPRSGDYFLTEIGGESIVVVRDESGTPRAHYNHCRHRGTRLCRDARGRFPGRIQCPYHGWTYSLGGELRSAPFMEKTQGFSRRDYPLHALACELWDGHVFLNFHPEPAPLSEQLADLRMRFRAWRMEELRPAHRVVYEVAANWKLIFQNYSECLHCPLLHPQLQRLSHFLSGENDPPQPTYLGGRMELRPEVASLTVDGASRWKPLPGLGEVERNGVYYYALLPNLLLNLHPDYVMTFTLWPRAHDRTEIVCEWHFHPDEIERPGFDPSPAVEFWDLTNRQDWEVCERAQEGIASRAYVPGPYSNREELLYALDRWVVSRLEEE